MNPGRILPYILIFILLPGCRKEDKGIIIEPPEESINLSDLETKHDYYLPFAIENDINDVISADLNNVTYGFTFGKFLEFDQNGFYELVLKYNDANKVSDTILFTTTTEEREESEWGIRAWIPVPYKPVGLGSENIEVFYPHSYTDSIKIPFIFYIRESGNIKSIYCQGKSLAMGEIFNIKQGVGSVNLNASLISTNADFSIGGRYLSIPVAKNTGSLIELSGTISSGIDIPSNTLVRISGNLNIASTGSLTVHEGALIMVDEAVDINVSGPVIFSGTASNPVLVTCSRKNSFWGGFITRVSGGTIEAHYTIFCQSGYHDSEGYDWGHAGRQALFYTENSTLELDHCFMLDHTGQIFYPENATLILNDILVQRSKTGGQINNSDLTLRNSVFTDFPDDSYLFQDNDNDALYLDGSNAVIENTTFMFAKDDGLDSGGGEGGIVMVTDCRFEACFHEGAALSSIDPAVKNHTFTGCVFTNCGQGLELGYSSPDHRVLAEDCLFISNGIGIRYGDNYDWSDVNGKITVKNSLSLYNDRDIWNMIRMIWSPKLTNMTFENTVVSELCPQYPELEVIK